MKRLVFATLFVCLSLQFACTKGTEYKTEAAREPLRISDSDLEKKIEAQFKADPQLRDTNLSVDADADRSLVTLSGTVESEAMRTRALELARAAHPGLTINDKIDVKPTVVSRSEYTPDMARAEVDKARGRKETVGGSLDDAWIHAKIVTQLLTDKDTPERKINVDVDHNVVTLRGTVDTMTAKEEAERIAKQTEGVKRVNNMLKVSRTE
jgi:hyperosmotically inducible protein